MKALDISRNCPQDSRLYSLLCSVEGLSKIAAEYDHFKWSENLTVTCAERSIAMDKCEEIIGDFNIT